MATAIYEEEEIRLIIMVWGLSWEHMTLGEANFLTVLGCCHPECGSPCTAVYKGTGRSTLSGRQ